mgnify:CR=1 FL=1
MTKDVELLAYDMPSGITYIEERDTDTVLKNYCVIPTKDLVSDDTKDISARYEYVSQVRRLYPLAEKGNIVTLSLENAVCHNIRLGDKK